MKLLHKKFGVESATTIVREKKAAAQIKEYIPTGIDVLDQYVIGQGGLPVGRMSEIFGPEACGKTTLGYSAIAACQRMGGIGVWNDPEHSFDEYRARLMGVDTKKLLLLQPESLEISYEQMKLVTQNHNVKKGPMLIVWDSIASSTPEAHLESEAGKDRMGMFAALHSSEIKKLIRLLPKYRTHLMALNQIRDQMGVSFGGGGIKTPGGNAPKFYSSVRLQFFGGKSIKNKDGEHTGKVVTIMAVKNRLAPPFRKARVRFDYVEGWNTIWSTLEHAKRFKLINPRTHGFKGKGVSGIDAYIDAIEELNWVPSIPIQDLRKKLTKGEEEEHEEQEDEEEDE